MSIAQHRSFLRERVLEIRMNMDEGTVSELGGCLDSAEKLLDSLDATEDIETEERLATAARLVDLVEKTMTAHIAVPSWADLSAEEFRSEDGLAGARNEEVHDLRTINDMMLGEILVQFGIASQTEVDKAMEVQDNTGMPVGETLCAMGVATPEDIQTGINLQHHLRRSSEESLRPDLPPDEKPVHDDTLLGEILLRLGIVEQHQIDEALRMQTIAGLRIGTALVAVGAADWGEIWCGVRLQKQLRKVSGPPTTFSPGFADQAPDPPAVFHFDDDDDDGFGGDLGGDSDGLGDFSDLSDLGDYDDYE